MSERTPFWCRPRYISRYTSELVSAALRVVLENRCIWNSKTLCTFTWNLGKILGKHMQSYGILVCNFTKVGLSHRDFSGIFPKQLRSFRKMWSNFHAKISVNFAVENKNNYFSLFSIFLCALFVLLPIS